MLNTMDLRDFFGTRRRDDGGQITTASFIAMGADTRPRDFRLSELDGGGAYVAMAILGDEDEEGNRACIQQVEACLGEAALRTLRDVLNSMALGDA